ncbi:MAG: helix-turn-helix transcriptional regulator [Flavobacterium sp.]
MIKDKISRQLRIITILRKVKGGMSKIELIEKVEKELKYFDEPFEYVEITFKRDLKDIRSNFNIEIIYDRKDNLYKLDSLKYDDLRLDLMLNSFKVYTTLLGFDTFPEHIIPENRKSNGLEHFGYISDAIFEKKYLEFDYFKFDTNLKVRKIVKPIALKESKNRWYLIGSYENNEGIRAFGLDRISGICMIDQKFKKTPEIEFIHSYYKDSFAMFSEGDVEKVVLSFDKTDGNYINSYPIHPSQKIEFDQSTDRYFITLLIKVTSDFMMELMSRAWSLEVLEPLSLRKKVAAIFYEAYQKNK